MFCAMDELMNPCLRWLDATVASLSLFSCYSVVSARITGVQTLYYPVARVKFLFDVISRFALAIESKGNPDAATGAVFKQHFLAV